MTSKEKTLLGGTMTTEGIIMHKEHDCGFYMPVKIAVRKGGVKAMLQPQQPQRDFKGRLIWALPGGGDFVAS